MTKLQIGQIFPEIAASSINGGTRQIPASLRRERSVLLFYRGHW